MKTLGFLFGFLAWNYCAPLLAVQVNSWQQIEDELGNGAVKISIKEHVHKSPTFKRLLAERNVAVFLEMSGQRESLPQMIGFYGLAELAPQTALEIAFKMALSPDTVAHAIPLYSALTEMPMDKGFNQALTLAFRTIPVDIGLTTVLVTGLPHERLWDWFHQDDRERVIPTYEAIVLERLFSDLVRKKKASTKRMQETLRKFAGVPGMPRVVYLAWANESEPGYKETMRLALEDESLPYPSLLSLFRTKVAYITKHFPFNELKLSEERREKLATALDILNHPKPDKRKSDSP